MTNRSGVLTAFLLAVPMLVGGCSTIDKATVETKGVAAERHGVGTITVKTTEGPTVLLFTIDEYGRKNADLISKGPIGQMEVSEARTASIAATIDLLKGLGIDAGAARTVAEQASITASAITKRYLKGGAVVRGVDDKIIPSDVVKALGRTDAQIIVEDYLIDGLVIEIERATVTNASVQRKLESAASSATGVVASASTAKAYVLRSKAPVCTNTGPIPCSAFSTIIGLAVDAEVRKRLADHDDLVQWKTDVKAVLNRKMIDWSKRTAKEFEASKGATLKELDRLFPAFTRRNDEIVKAIYDNDKQPKK